MGLDWTIKKDGVEMASGNGRVRYGYIRDWSKSKNVYGKDIELTDKDVIILIKDSILNFLATGYDIDEDLLNCLRHAYRESGWTLECDW